MTRLRAGGLPSPTGKVRQPWSPRLTNYMLGLPHCSRIICTRARRFGTSLYTLIGILADLKQAKTFPFAELR